MSTKEEYYSPTKVVEGESDELGMPSSALWNELKELEKLLSVDFETDRLQRFLARSKQILEEFRYTRPQDFRWINDKQETPLSKFIDMLTANFPNRKWHYAEEQSHIKRENIGAECIKILLDGFPAATFLPNNQGLYPFSIHQRRRITCEEWELLFEASKPLTDEEIHFCTGIPLEISKVVAEFIGNPLINNNCLDRRTNLHKLMGSSKGNMAWVNKYEANVFLLRLQRLIQAESSLIKSKDKDGRIPIHLFIEFEYFRLIGKEEAKKCVEVLLEAYPESALMNDPLHGKNLLLVAATQLFTEHIFPYESGRGGYGIGYVKYKNYDRLPILAEILRSYNPGALCVVDSNGCNILHYLANLPPSNPHVRHIVSLSSQEMFTQQNDMGEKPYDTFTRKWPNSQESIEDLFYSET